MKNCKIKFTAVLLAAMMIASFAGCNQQNSTEGSKTETSAPSVSKDSISKDTETIYQVALLQSLTQGYYDGIIKVSELKGHGDTGIGTFEGVNGEMIVIDGKVYQALGDGTVQEAADDETVPFSNVTFFDSDVSVDLKNINDMASFKAELNKTVAEKGKNMFYVVKVSGTFEKMLVRSELKQEKPYRSLDKALETDQREFSYENIAGTVVGLYCPDYMGGLNAVGWHFHFISDDRTKGGHILELSFKNAKAELDITPSFDMKLSDNTDFQNMELAKNVDEAIKKVETETKTNGKKTDNDPSLEIAADAVVSYLGPEGTYTEEAAKYFFKDTNSFIPKKTVDEAIEEVKSGQADYAVIPQENTIGGAVTNYVDALIRETDIYVVGEVIIPINQTLMGIEGASLSDIKTVCSHAQGLAQSKTWRSENLPDAAEKEMDSTAAAASFVAESKDKTIAAVAAPGAAPLYGLTVLAENVQISDANKTRFYVLSKTRNESGKRAVFIANCEASEIDDIIVDAHNAGFETVTLHDRPDGTKLGSYNYLLETEAENISNDMIEKITAHSGVRFAGCFDMSEKTNN